MARLGRSQDAGGSGFENGNNVETGVHRIDDRRNGRMTLTSDERPGVAAHRDQSEPYGDRSRPIATDRDRYPPSGVRSREG